MARHETVYIGVVGSDLEYGSARDTIEAIVRRPGDSIQYVRATKGFEARQRHIDAFMATHHDFICLLDQDMVFQPETVAHFRSLNKPYISGFYLRRLTDPIAPVWYRPYKGVWPLEPWIGLPSRDRLHPIGASGWGCIFIHRDVIAATRKVLKGEWYVLEDDMDVWPYDLGEIMRAIRGLRALVDEKPSANIVRAALKDYVAALESEIVPLRCDRDIIGSDIRFPVYALKAGYQLLGDANISPGHIVDYPLSIREYMEFSPAQLEKGRKDTHEYVLRERRRFKDQKARLLE